MIRLRKILVITLASVIAASFAACSWIAYEGARAEKKKTPSDVTKLVAVVNGVRSVDVIPFYTSDGLTRIEATLIVEATFIQVMGQDVTHRLDTLTFNDTQIEAHYTWGQNENDMGHFFYINADLTTLQITVTHCL